MKRIDYDKRMHFGAGFLIALIAAAATSFVWWLTDIDVSIVPVLTTSAPILAGIGKEYCDKFRKKSIFDIKDMLATWTGGAVVFIPVILLYVFI